MIYSFDIEAYGNSQYVATPNRVYYAVQQIGISPASSGNQYFTALHGIQSAGASTRIPTEPVSEFGAIPIAATLQSPIDVNLNLTKVLDGYPLILLSATSDAATPILSDRLMQRCSIALSIYDDSLTWYAISSGTAIVQFTGLYISNASYKFDTDSPFEETVGFEGSNKIWNLDTRIISPQDLYAQSTITNSDPGQFTNNDAPQARDVGMRWDFILPNTGISGIDASIFPVEVLGQHVTSIHTNFNVSRYRVPQFGSKAPYFRMPRFPVEITTEFVVRATGFDAVSVSDIGILTSVSGGCVDQGNTSGQFINIATCDGLRLSLGPNNYLIGTTWQGADTHGSNVKISYIYKTFNDFTMVYTTGDINWNDRQGWLQPTIYDLIQQGGWGTITTSELALMQV